MLMLGVGDQFLHSLGFAKLREKVLVCVSDERLERARTHSRTRGLICHGAVISMWRARAEHDIRTAKHSKYYHKTRVNVMIMNPCN
jgi:hypothetical protein